MSSKRAIRRRACEGKVRYESREVAFRSAGCASARLNTHLTCYRCQSCGSYHIGHPPYKESRAAAQRRLG